MNIYIVLFINFMHINRLFFYTNIPDFVKVKDAMEAAIKQKAVVFTSVAWYRWFCATVSTVEKYRGTR